MSRLEVIYDHVCGQFHFFLLGNLVFSSFGLILNSRWGYERMQYVGEVVGEFVGEVVLMGHRFVIVYLFPVLFFAGEKLRPDSFGQYRAVDDL
jgi:hypothetical protein